MIKTFLSVFSILLISQTLKATEVSPSVTQATLNNQKLDLVLYFNEKADLTNAQNILHRQSRVAFVHSQLITTALKTQKKVKNFLIKNKIRHISFFSTNAIAVFNIPTTLINDLKNFSELRFIGPNVKSTLNLPDAPIMIDDSEGIASHLNIIKVDQAWDEFGVKGEGIVIAGQDTGYHWTHPALQKKYRGWSSTGVSHDYNWHDGIGATENAPCSTNGASPCDDKDHGTHTMGSMIGDDEQGNQIGVAPEARWIGCRNMRDGTGTVASYLSCFDFFIAPYPIGGDPIDDGRPDLAPHIVNNSWSCPKKEGCQGDEFASVIDAYKAAGILLVVAAGNDGPGCDTASEQPAIYAGDVISVGAWNRYMGEIAFFSGRGPSPLYGQVSPNLIAPGGSVRSSIKSGYESKMGTSMAAPQVAGAVALMWSHDPSLIGQIDTTIDILQRTATPKKTSQSCGNYPGNKTPNAVYGYGMLNVLDALKEL